VTSEEKRKFSRLPLNVKVEYSVLGKLDSVIITTESKNVSASGICIFLIDKFDFGILLKLKFLLPDADRGIIATGRVVWSEEVKTNNIECGKHYETGIEFVYISEEERKQINEYAKRGI